MKRVAAADGYEAATVARVSATAGVSRVSFYQRFRNREDCFLACCQEAIAAFEGAVSASVSESGTATPCAVVDAVLRELGADPGAARLILLEALAGPGRTRLEHEGLIAHLESQLGAVSGGEGSQPSSLWIPASALLGGVLGVAAIPVLHDRAAELESLAPALRTWVGSYAAAPAELPLTEEQWANLGRELAARTAGGLAPAPPTRPSRRERLVAATAEATARNGYAALRVSDIVALAQVRRGSFYKEFRDKKDAFRAVQVLNLQRSVAAAAGQFSLGGTWPDRVWGGLAALLGYVARHPEEARLAVVEVYAAGEEALRLAQHSRSAFTLFLEEGYREPRGTGLPTLCSEAVGAAIHFLIRRAVASGQARRLPQLLPQSAFIALAPFLGPRKALAFVELKIREAAKEPRRDWRDVPAARAPAGTGPLAGPA